VFDTSVDWTDLADKMHCMMDFAAKACSADYGDSFLVNLKRSPPEQPKKVVELQWFCLWMSPPPNMKKDARDHEALLRQYFKKYDLCIEKMPYRWEVLISTPLPHRQKPKHCVEFLGCDSGGCGGCGGTSHAEGGNDDDTL